MTTLPLYWKLSSASENDRISATLDLVSSLETFQTKYVPEPYLNGHSTDNNSSAPQSYLDSLTSEDVRYALKRLTRGLASPKESSRLGFAVALTEVSTRLPCSVFRH